MSPAGDDGSANSLGTSGERNTPAALGWHAIGATDVVHAHGVSLSDECTTANVGGD
jgi:hypothetical protein